MTTAGTSRTLAALMTGIIVSAVGFAPTGFDDAFAAASGTDQKARAAATKRCGVVGGAHRVSAVGAVKCRKARKLVRRFRVQERRVQHGDGSLATTYWTVPGFPGWRCGLGSGGGGCRYKSTGRRVFWETR